MFYHLIFLGLVVYQPEKVDHVGDAPLDDPPGEGTPQSRKAVGQHNGSPLTAGSETELLHAQKNQDNGGSSDSALEKAEDKNPFSNANVIGRTLSDALDPCNGDVRRYYIRENDLDVGSCRRCKWDNQPDGVKFFTCLPQEDKIDCTFGSEDEFFASNSFGMVCRGGDRSCDSCCSKTDAITNIQQFDWESNTTCCTTAEKARMPTDDGKLPTCTEPSESTSNEVQDMLDLCNKPAVYPFFLRQTNTTKGACRKCPGIVGDDSADKFFKCMPDKTQEEVHCRQNITTAEEWMEQPWYGVKCRGTGGSNAAQIRFPGCQVCCSKATSTWEDEAECCCNGAYCDSYNLTKCNA